MTQAELIALCGLSPEEAGWARQVIYASGAPFAPDKPVYLSTHRYPRLAAQIADILRDEGFTVRERGWADMRR